MAASYPPWDTANPQAGTPRCVTGLTVAAVGDLHASEEHRDRLAASFSELGGTADIVLLAGDLTTHGAVGEAAVLADACRLTEAPVVAVLGNHDHHGGCEQEVAATLVDAGVVVLDRSHVVVDAGGMQVGVAGTKGFVGGFPGAEIADFGERLLRDVYAETTREVAALEAGLESVAGCDHRLVLLHYAPVAETLVGEPEGIWAFLGSGRLAAPIGAHRPDAVFHGHAHHGRPLGSIGTVPVHNVARQVLDGDFLLVHL
jgi:Icc-related predicted phosphoesterase